MSPTRTTWTQGDWVACLAYLVGAQVVGGSPLRVFHFSPIIILYKPMVQCYLWTLSMATDCPTTFVGTLLNCNQARIVGQVAESSKSLKYLGWADHEDGPAEYGFCRPLDIGDAPICKLAPLLLLLSIGVLLEYGTHGHCGNATVNYSSACTS